MVTMNKKPTMADDAGLVALADLLAEHDEVYPSGCDCGAYRPESIDVFRHRDEWRHHRDALLADWLTEHDARVRAETLAKTADRWIQGAWSNVMLPKPTPPAVPVVAYSNRFGDWLSKQADECRNTPGKESDRG